MVVSMNCDNVLAVALFVGSICCPATVCYEPYGAGENMLDEVEAHALFTSLMIESQ